MSSYKISMPKECKKLYHLLQILVEEGWASNKMSSGAVELWSAMEEAWRLAQNHRSILTESTMIEWGWSDEERDEVHNLNHRWDLHYHKDHEYPYALDCVQVVSFWNDKNLSDVVRQEETRGTNFKYADQEIESMIHGIILKMTHEMQASEPQINFHNPASAPEWSSWVYDRESDVDLTLESYNQVEPSQPWLQARALPVTLQCQTFQQAYTLAELLEEQQYESKDQTGMFTVKLENLNKKGFRHAIAILAPIAAQVLATDEALWDLWSGSILNLDPIGPEKISRRHTELRFIWDHNFSQVLAVQGVVMDLDNHDNLLAKSIIVLPCNDVTDALRMWTQHPRPDVSWSVTHTTEDMMDEASNDEIREAQLEAAHSTLQ